MLKTKWASTFILKFEEVWIWGVFTLINRITTKFKLDGVELCRFYI